MFKSIYCSKVFQILTLAIPLIISYLSFIGMGAVDTITAGLYSAEDLAGLGVGSNIWIILEVVIAGLISAITPRMARFFGANQHSEITSETQQALVLGGILGVIAMAVMFAIIPFIPLLGAPPKVTFIAQNYIQIIAYSFPASSICWVLFCLLESHGLMRFVVLSSIVAILLNILLNYILVFGKFGFPALGSVGCAWATTIIYWLWTICCVLYTFQHTQLKTYQIYASWPRFNKKRWKEILALGIPISLALLAEESIFNISTMLIAHLGTESLGAHQITIQIISLVLVFGLGIGQATSIFVAQSIGKSQTRTMFKDIYTSFGLVSSVGLIVGVIVFSFRSNLPHLFTNNFNIATISEAIMLFAPIFLLCDVLQAWAAQTLRGFEDTKIPMIFQVSSFWLIGFPLGYSLALTTLWGEKYGIYGFWIGFLGGIITAAFLLCSRLYFKAHEFSEK